MNRLNVLTIAAAIVFGAPAWAQAPATPSASPPTAAPKARQMHDQVVHRRGRHYVVHHRGGSGSAADSVADQLNSQELARLQGGMPPSAPVGSAPSGQSHTLESVDGWPSVGRAKCDKTAFPREMIHLLFLT